MNRNLNIKVLLLMGGLFISTTSVHSQNWITPFEAGEGKITPRYEETKQYFEQLATTSSIISFGSFGESPQGRSLMMVVADKDGLSNPEQIREKGRMIILIQACIHPGESDGKDAGMLLLRDMGIKGLHLDLLENVSLVFLPIYNVDGHERFGRYNRINQNGPEEMGWRTTSTNLNLNRDFLKVDAPETFAWLKLWNYWDFDFFIDIHTTDGADFKYVVTYQIETGDNMEEGLGNWCSQTFIPAFEQGMTQAGVPVYPYITFRKWTDPTSGLSARVSPPRLSNGFSAICNRPGLLIETHMLKDYKTRVEGTYEALIQTLIILKAQKINLLNLEKKADEYVASEAFRQKPYPVRFNSTEVSRKVWFDGFEFEQVTSPITGGIYYRYTNRPASFELDLFDQIVTTDSVWLPEYYIIPPQYTELRKRFDAHGIEYTLLEKEEPLQVTMTRFSDPQWARTPYEGRFPLDVKSDTFNTVRSFPKGSIVIPMSQRRAAIIAHILEPTAPDSYAYWGFFNGVFEQKEYAEDYVIEPLAIQMLEDFPGLKSELDEKMKDPAFAGNRRAINNWFYMHTPYWDQEKDLYPVGKIFDKGIRF